MKKICLFNFPVSKDFHGYQVETFDPLSYFSKASHWPFSDFLISGKQGYSHQRAIVTGAMGVDRLYRERNSEYMRMASDFVEIFRDFDAIIMASFNFIHPEILTKELYKPIKVLGCIDDPPATYASTIPNLWAFDGAFYISPSYIDGLDFSDALERWGCKKSKWWPLVPFPYEKPPIENDAFFKNRDLDILYVGNPSSTKVDRLIHFKKHFGDRIRIHGRWALNGYSGVVRGLFGKPIYPHRVTSLSAHERTSLYWRSKIGLNMHFSEQRYETGNMRMYEVPAHGAMLLCDKGGANAHDRIFKSGKEAIYYDGINEAIEMTEYYLIHEEERCAIAKAGYNRYWGDYEWEKNMTHLLDWSVSLKDNS